MTDTRQDSAVLHYAGCPSCELWDWAESKHDAVEKARGHREKTGHPAYTDTIVDLQ